MLLRNKHKQTGLFISDKCNLEESRKSAMDIGDFNFKTDFDKQCGEIFLTIRGNMMFHCTLCERIYKGYPEYANHVTQMHILESIEEDIISGINSITPISNERIANSDFIDTNDGKVQLEENKILLDIGVQDTNTEGECPNQKSTITDTETKEYTKDTKDVIENKLKGHDIEEISALPKKRKRKRNEKTQKRIHKCCLCDFVCNDRSNLVSHVRRHSGERPHQCQECSKAFYTRTELNTHLRIHTGERPFLCTICGRSFKTSGILTDHVKRHKNFRSKECNICEKKFYNKDMLRKHLATHSEERPFKCNICDASFKQSNGLRNHKKIHENKREYQCNLCLARFNQKPGLHSHMKSKHSLKSPLSVPGCMEDINKSSSN